MLESPGFSHGEYVKDELTATGAIELNPINPETKQIDNVLVNGGIDAQTLLVRGKTKTQSLEVSDETKTKDLTVLNDANINQLTVNNGVKITGDLIIDHGKINLMEAKLALNLMEYIQARMYALRMYM